MKHRPITRVLATLAALSVVVLAACGGDDDTSATTDTSAATDGEEAPAETQSLTLGYYPNSALSLAWFVAEEHGFFDDSGLDVEMVPFKSGPENVAALIGGTSQVGVGGPANAMPPMVAGESLVVSGPALGLNYLLVAVADEVPSDIEAGSDEALQALKGKAIGVPALGGAAEIFARVLLEEAGMDPDSDVTFIGVGSAATSVPALAENQIQAIVASGATPDLARAQGVELVTIANALDGTAGDLGDNESAVFGILNKDFAESAAMDRYCEAISGAIDWLHDPANAEAGAALTAEVTGLDLDLATKLYDSEADAWRLQVTEKGWDEDTAWTLESGQELPYDGFVRECG